MLLIDWTIDGISYFVLYSSEENSLYYTNLLFHKIKSVVVFLKTIVTFVLSRSLEINLFTQHNPEYDMNYVTVALECPFVFRLFSSLIQVKRLLLLFINYKPDYFKVFLVF